MKDTHLSMGIRPAQKHVYSLEDCARCQAWKYLVVRDNGRRVFLYLQHLEKSPRKSRMKLLFSIKKSELEIHD
jgi:hypothetical protein